jgi:hypothetical protein
VDEVVSTPISLPVKERIARGLSEAGASNTLKVVTYNSALGIIAVFAPGAIHQFCVFALVVLVAHWFLVHTFFVAVLSIDLQRLEVIITTWLYSVHVLTPFTAVRVTPSGSNYASGYQGESA